MLLLLWYFSVLLKLSFSQFRYRVWPPHSPERPLTRQFYEISPLDPVSQGLDPDDTIIYVEQLEFIGSAIDPSVVPASSSEWVVINQINTTTRAPYVRVFEKYTTYNWTDLGPEYIRVSTISQQSNGIELSFLDSVTVIYWDFRYSTLKYDFEFLEDDTVPGTVDVIAVPRTPFDAELEKQTRIWWFLALEFTDVLSGAASKVGVNDNNFNQISETNRMRVMFREPRVLYFRLRSYNGWGRDETSSRGLNTQSFPRRRSDESVLGGLALVCCSEDDTCPSVISGFDGITHILTSCPIPGDRQLSLKKSTVAVIEEHPIYIRLFRSMYTIGAAPPPSYVDIELPQGLQFSSWFECHDALQDCPDQPPAHGGSVTKRFVFPPYEGFDSTFPFAVDFTTGEDSVIGQELPVFFKLEGTGVAWQRLMVVPKRVPDTVGTSPTRIVCGFTWDTLDQYRSIEDYANLGFNQVSRHGYRWNIDAYEPYSLDVRKATWPDGLTFGPEISLFIHSNPSTELYGLFTALSDTVTDDSKFPSYLSAPQVIEERQKWQNAIDFYANAGSVRRRNDFAYNGVIYRRHLEHFGDFLNYTRPEWVVFDIEDFVSKSTFLQYIHLSQNAQDRRLHPGESDEELYDRMSAEMLQDIRNVFDECSPATKIAWYAVESTNNAGYIYGSWTLFDSHLGNGRISHGLASQPELYVYPRAPQVVQDIVRGSKLYLNPGDELIPMPSHGCYGEYSSSLTLDWCIQIFANGGTGLQIYGYSYVDDADDLLFIKECMNLVGPYEDILMDDGNRLAFYDLHDISDNLVVGAISNRESSEYFIGISPNYQVHPASWEGQFQLDTPGASFVRVFDARVREYVSSERISLSKGTLTIWFEEIRSTVLHVRVENSRYLASLVTGIVFGIAAVLLVLLAVAAVVFVSICSSLGQHHTKRPEEDDDVDSNMDDVVQEDN